MYLEVLPSQRDIASRFSAERLSAILGARQHKVIFDSRLARAAVLLLLFEKQGQPGILFTKRTTNVAHHKGQISFPGGAWDAEDATLEATALRETFEEIGVRVEDVRVLGRLDDTTTATSNFVVSPFVATMPYPYQFVPNRAELEQIIEVPLAALLDKSRFTGDARVSEGMLHPVYFFDCGEHLIWGATARMLRHFLDLVLREG